MTLLNNIRRETMFINILEGLHPLEAEIITLVKDKKLETKYKSQKISYQKHIQISLGVVDHDDQNKDGEERIDLDK